MYMVLLCMSAFLVTAFHFFTFCFTDCHLFLSSYTLPILGSCVHLLSNFPAPSYPPLLQLPCLVKIFYYMYLTMYDMRRMFFVVVNYAVCIRGEDFVDSAQFLSRKINR